VRAALHRGPLTVEVLLDCGGCSFEVPGSEQVQQCAAKDGKGEGALGALWTNGPLVAARHLYLQRGFVLVSEEPHHSFGVDLIGQVYQRDLHPNA